MPVVNRNSYVAQSVILEAFVVTRYFRDSSFCPPQSLLLGCIQYAYLVIVLLPVVAPKMVVTPSSGQHRLGRVDAAAGDVPWPSHAVVGQGWTCAHSGIAHC